MKDIIKAEFRYQWAGFSLEIFRQQFPYVLSEYDLEISDSAEVIFYSVFDPFNERFWPDRRLWLRVMPVLPAGNYVRVFISGENVEPDMNHCDFAISFSTIVEHPNHLHLPLWVYDLRRWGYTPESLVKPDDSDWEYVASTKNNFCNFIYSHPVSFRNAIFAACNKYKHVVAAGRCENNMDGWLLPNDDLGKINFLRPYKFTLAIENSIWPGYLTEKLVEPMLVNSIPIYVGDPLAPQTFNRESYIDYSSFDSIKHMVDFVREIDNDKSLYLKMLSVPFYRDNRVPGYAKESVIKAFFDSIFDEVKRRR